MVYEEVVEGGITRFVADLPLRRCPPRSARSARSAPPTRRSLGRSARPLLRVVAAATPASSRAVHGSSLIDVGYDAVPRRTADREPTARPHNLFADVGRALPGRGRRRRSRRRRCSPYRDAGRAAVAARPPVRGVRVDFGGVAAAPRSTTTGTGRRQLARAARTARPTSTRTARSDRADERRRPVRRRTRRARPTSARSPEAQTRRRRATPGCSPTAGDRRHVAARAVDQQPQLTDRHGTADRADARADLDRAARRGAPGSTCSAPGAPRTPTPEPAVRSAANRLRARTAAS